jgi:uncharacterized membrane protein
MTPEVYIPEPEPKKMSEVARIGGVLFEPGKTFDDIARKPTWIVPLAMVIVVVLAMFAVFSQRVGWERMVRHQFEMSSRAAQMDPAQREQAIQMQTRFAGPFSVGGVILGIPIVDLIWAALLFGIVKGIMNAPVRYKQVFAALVWAGIPGVISTILTIAVLYLKNPDDFNLQNPLVFNPGALMDPTTSSKFVYSLASSLDLFMIWMLILVGIGLKAAGGRKLSTGGAMSAVFIPWAIWIFGKAALAGIFA